MSTYLWLRQALCNAPAWTEERYAPATDIDSAHARYSDDMETLYKRFCSDWRGDQGWRCDGEFSVDCPKEDRQRQLVKWCPLCRAQKLCANDQLYQTIRIEGDDADKILKGAAHQGGDAGWSLSEAQKTALLKALIVFDKSTRYEGGVERHSRAVLAALRNVNAWESMGYKQVTLQTV